MKKHIGHSSINENMLTLHVALDLFEKLHTQFHKAYKTFGFTCMTFKEWSSKFYVKAVVSNELIKEILRGDEENIKCAVFVALQPFLI